MSSRTLDRKQFISLVAASAAIGTFLQACGDDGTPAAGTGGSGTGGSGTAGKASGGATGTAGTGGATGTAGTTAGGGTGGGGTGSSGGTASSGGTGGGGTGSGGRGGTGSSGGTGAGGTGGGGRGGTGSGGSGGGGGSCGTATIMHTSSNPHTHLVPDAATVAMSVKTLINGATPTMAFTLPSQAGPAGEHVHTFMLTADEVATLKSGGMVKDKKTVDDATGHSHTYTIVCAA